MSNWLMLAYMLASDDAYLDKNDEGGIDIYLDNPALFPFPVHHKIELNDVPDIFSYWQAASRHPVIDVNITDEQWRMMMEMCESGVAFFSRYNEETNHHDGVVQLVLNANDVFYWACADAEQVSFDQVAEVYAIWKADGFNGLVKWMCEKRGMRPQIPLIDMMRKESFNMDWIEKLEIPGSLFK